MREALRRSASLTLLNEETRPDTNVKPVKDQPQQTVLQSRMNALEKDEKKRKELQEKDNSIGSGGGCLMMLIGLPLWLPAALVAALLHIK